MELSPIPIPGDLQLKVISMSFPNDVEDIRLYSTLASGSADQFNRGEDLYNYKAVQDCLQIGKLLNNTDNSDYKNYFLVCNLKYFVKRYN